MDMLDRWRAYSETASHIEVAETVLDESGYTEMWQREKSPDAPGRLENLKELVRALEEFDNLGGFLEHISLVMEANENAQGDMVNIMTLHSAKGLEFDTVFLPGWEEGLFPHQRTIDDAGSAGLEEERRLAYVGLTRAKKRAAVSFVANRRVHNQWTSAIPSRFVDELPAEQVEVVSDSGLYSGAAVFPGAGGFANAGAAYDWDRRSTGRGPGFDRLRSARTRRDLVIEGAARPVRNAAAEGLAVGSRVFHQKFGYGRVRAAEGDKLEIEFDKAGRKKVLASFVAAA
jgi:DNA helicase-2/ATP-dependent DNA helicase PcrA